LQWALTEKLSRLSFDWIRSGNPKQALVASPLCDLISRIDVSAERLGHAWEQCPRLTDEVYLNFDHRKGPCQGHHQILVNRKDKA
jgi:hypothetical protein